MEKIKAISFLSEKNTETALESLSEYHITHTTRFDFTEITTNLPILNDVICNSIKALQDKEFSVFILGAIGQINNIIFTELLLLKKNTKNIQIIIVVSIDSMINASKDNKNIYCTMLNNADKVIFLADNHAD